MSFRGTSFTPQEQQAELREKYEKGFTNAEASVNAEQRGDTTTAAVYMQEAIEAFQHAVTLETSRDKQQLLKTKIEEFAQDYKRLVKTANRSSGGHLAGTGQASTISNESASKNKAKDSEDQVEKCIQFAQFYREQGGRAADEKRLKDAKDLYEVAAQEFMKAAKLTGKKVQVKYNAYLREVEGLIQIMTELDKAIKEEAKSPAAAPESVLDLPAAPSGALKPRRGSRALGGSAKPARKQATSTTVTEEAPVGSVMSAEEKQVLLRSSRINGKEYLPWIPSDTTEQLQSTGSNLFTDPDGKLPLSPAQAKVFGRWVRASELMRGGNRNGKRVVPKMVHAISHYSVSQELVTNCSFVSSLCITASYERRFGKKLITKIIYPQTRAGEPVYNPSGKYTVKLHFNGVARKVIIDDYLPVSKQGRLICSFSTNPGELWVSILEKAYMKLNGGYDFPGSNSGIDLYALTGWIPETVQLDDLRTDIALRDKTWSHMMNGLRHGDVLCTVATGTMSDQHAANLGLVPTHAYAVLEVREVQGIRLLQLKNPWAHMRWKGPYSPSDTSGRWTPALKEALQYDQVVAMQHDNGIFWIDFDSLLQYFTGLYFNWNLALLPYKIPLHRHWDHKLGPAIDTYNVGYNPQFALLVNVPTTGPQAKPAIVWVVISRHVTDKMQLLSSDDSDFMAIHVYAKRQGNRVYYPSDPLVKGKYSNNPHGLVSFEAPPGENAYTLVASLFEKRRPHDFTLTVYTHAQAKMRQLEPTKKHVTKVRAEWNSGNAGGSGRHPSFMVNPQWRFTIAEKSRLLVRLEAPRDTVVNVRVCKGGQRVCSVSESEEVATSGDYHHGFCYLDHRRKLPPGDYTIIPSTFEPGTEAMFHLYVEADVAFNLSEIPKEGAGMHVSEMTGQWSKKDGTAVGCSNYGNYDRNPWIHLRLATAADVKVRIQGEPVGGKSASFPSVNASIYSVSGNGPSGYTLDGRAAPQSAALSTNNGVFSNPPSGTASKVSKLPAGNYLIVPATFKPLDTTFKVILYTSVPPAVFKRVR